MTTTNAVFLTGEVWGNSLPLGRYLPRLPKGAAAAWLSENLPLGSWVIDPYGASPELAVEIARAGYRLLVAANNPISRFLIEMTASPPSVEEMRAALAELASSRRGDERLEPHIRTLYTTICDHCGAEVDAQYFLWERDAQAPYGRVYACPNCKQAGEFPATEEDISRAIRFHAQGPHRSRALERVATADSPDRIHVEEALDAYLPRAVYALFNILNKLDGLRVSEEQKAILHLLLLYTCDQANTLWHYPAARARPRQLSTPAKFMEHNIWLALENTISNWGTQQSDVALRIWPELPPQQGGICLYEGRIKELTPELSNIPINAIVSALPRPNQAFWTLSALWAGWLWGREALGPFAVVLRRRRYDWAWHTTALESSLRRLSPILQPGTPFFALITENTAGFDAAAITAADLAGFTFKGVALRPNDGQSQYHWQKTSLAPPSSRIQPRKIAAQAVEQTIQERGEPTAYLYLQTAALQALNRANALGSLIKDQESPRARAAAAYTAARELIEETLIPTGDLIRYQGGKSSIEIGRWWPRHNQVNAPPLADRVEVEIVNQLQEHAELSFTDLEKYLCQSFPGLLTPEPGLIRTILESYAEQSEAHTWRLRENDATATRRDDVEEMRALLTEIGTRLGMQVSGTRPLVWQSNPGAQNLYFYVVASANISKIIQSAPHPPDQGIIVLPGGRASLILEKLERNPHLADQIDAGWRFLKFRYLRRMAETSMLTLENLPSSLTLDPITSDDPQMPLL
ncbi:MAG: hypothetical protein ABFS17_14430 [Chloroflexota bacterium]